MTLKSRRIGITLKAIWAYNIKDCQIAEVHTTLDRGYTPHQKKISIKQLSF
jgi:hypothetical protein